VRILALSLGLLGVLGACSSQRKMPRLETRAPSAAHGSEALSALRERLMATVLPATCPSEIREQFPRLVDERVHFPPCPERLAGAFEAAKPVLTSGERAAVDELLGNQCRLLPGEQGGNALEDLLSELEGGPSANGEAMRLRSLLREGLAEARLTHEPLAQWSRLNGDHVLSESELSYFERLLAVKGCRLSGDDLGQSYRVVHSLEALARAQPEGAEQRRRIESFLSGVHKVIGRKIREYFQ